MKPCPPHFLPILACLLATAPPSAHSQEPTQASAQVEWFSPMGYLKQIRQVTARFSAPMVALGDPRLKDPFTVNCPAAGKGRWADPRNWVYDFDNDLEGGVSCSFSLRSGLKTLAGAPVTGRSTFSFNTGGPAIIASLPREGWTALDENQIFLLRLDAAATTASIEAHAYCAIEGIAERIPLEVLAGQERQAVLEQRKALGYDYLRLLFKNGVVADVRTRNRALEQADASITVLRCRRQLPAAAKVVLDWGAGIAAPSGIATRQDQLLVFHVRPAFTAQVECTRANLRAGCMPMLPIAVNFTAPVPRALALGIRLKTADGNLLAPEAKETASVPTVEGVTFPGPFPEQSVATVTLPAGLTDDAGRVAENAARFPLEVRIDAYPPLVKFSANFGILELKEGGILPVTLRNVEPALAARESSMAARLLRLEGDAQTIAAWLERVEKHEEPSGEWVATDSASSAEHKGLKQKLADQEDEEEGGAAAPEGRIWRDTTGANSVFQISDPTIAFEVTKPEGEKPEEVVGIPLKQPGFYVIELQSHALGLSLLGRDQARYVATAALVTDLAVHFKWGRESSLAWVTRLSDGAPVASADLAVSNVCSGQSLWHGTTGPDGTATIAQSLGDPTANTRCYSARAVLLMVVAKKGDDFSFTESAWHQGIRPYEFSLPTGSVRTAGIYHTVLDRALFRAGEWVSMKHFLRRHASSGIIVPADSEGSHTIEIVHEGSGQRYTLSGSFDSNGVATTRWKIPEEAKLGEYSVSIDHHPSAGFKVEQFRLPSMRGSISGPAMPLVAPRQVELNLHVAYLAGGGAGGLPVKVRTVVDPEPQHFDGYPDYEFGGAPVKEGVRTEALGPAELDFEAEPERQTTRTQTIPLTLDASGSGRVTVGSLPPLAGPARLVAELEYPDANGELLTSSGSVRLVPASLSVGIRREGWVGSAEQLRFRVVVLNLDGKPQSEQPIVVSLYQSNAYSYRKRLIGGFYSYETTRETKKLTPTCTGSTDAQGVLACEIAPGASGEIIVRAETHDAHNTLAGATATMWITDRHAWWFGGTKGDRMDVLPEKKEYEAGETARFQVRMPFRAATALVTIEREGVLSSFVTQLHGDAPIVEVPIAPNYAPNAFVSVLAVRGRLAHNQGTAGKATPSEEITSLVDLNKPAYRLGLTQIKVGWRPHRLNVQVQPEHKIYKIRDKAAVKIQVTTADGHPLPAGTEVAVAAVDEALLDLAPNSSWELLKSMMGQRGLEVWTSTAQMQVVGKRHYGRKAIPHGGGGGRGLDLARELFDSLLYWQPRIPLDSEGSATLSIPLNDSLSSFRIVAVASGGAQLFGNAASTITTTQDLILLSALPPLVREGDQYAATFTLRNTTDHPITAHVEAAAPALRAGLTAQDAQIPAGQARDLVWTVNAPVDAGRIDWDVTARDTNSTARDHLKVSETVVPAYPVRTYQATIAQLTTPLSVPAQQPKGAIAGRGGLEVSLQAKLGDRLDGVREYMTRYPYTCIEQLISRAVALRSRSDWDALMRRLPAYMDADGLLKYFPTDRLQGDDGLTAYVLAIGSEAGYDFDENDKARLLAALTRFVEGKLVRYSALPTADLSIRKLQAIDALSRYGAARPNMLDSITVEPNLLPTSALLDWLGILKRTAGVAQADNKSAQALGLLRARLNFQGTTMGFSSERSDALWWLMISTDSNANRLLLAVLDRSQWREDMPRLVRGALGRQQFGHWNTTVANAWGALAMEKFSAAFESIPVSGSSAIRYGPQQRIISWPQLQGEAALSLPWVTGVTTLGIAHVGTGAPWAMVRATAALPLDQPLSSGFRIARTVSPIEQQRAGAWTRGDVARVHLELDAQADMSWVVVDDPIPAGATVLGGGLGGQSELLQRDDRSSGWAWLAFEERRFDSYRAYYRFVPKGHWTLEYTVRLNNPGTFVLPTTRVEAMYAPEMLGELPNAAVTVAATGDAK